MIYYAMISRWTDGLILTANSDSPPMAQQPGLQDAFKNLKLLGRVSGNLIDIRLYNVRQTLNVNSYSIHFVKTSLNLTFFVLCDATYPEVLAFSFLKELQKEYIDFYGFKKTTAVQRPYALMDFDIHLQKLKQRYNSPRSLSTQVDLQELSKELNRDRPFRLQLEDMQNALGHSKTDQSCYKSTAAIIYNRYMPFPLYGLLSLALNCFCAFLNLTRGIAVISEAHQDIIFDIDHYQYGATFIVCCFLSLYQAYLMCYPLKRRKPLAFATLGSICLCQLYLWEYRNNIGIMFHVTVACYGTFVIFTRKVQEKLPQYTL